MWWALPLLYIDKEIYFTKQSGYNLKHKACKYRESKIMKLTHEPLKSYFTVEIWSLYEVNNSMYYKCAKKIEIGRRRQKQCFNGLSGSFWLKSKKSSNYHSALCSLPCLPVSIWRGKDPLDPQPMLLRRVDGRLRFLGVARPALAVDGRRVRKDVRGP